MVKPVIFSVLFSSPKCRVLALSTLQQTGMLLRQFHSTSNFIIKNGEAIAYSSLFFHVRVIISSSYMLPLNPKFELCPLSQDKWLLYVLATRKKVHYYAKGGKSLNLYFVSLILSLVLQYIFLDGIVCATFFLQSDAFNIWSICILLDYPRRMLSSCKLVYHLFFGKAKMTRGR